MSDGGKSGGGGLDLGAIAGLNALTQSNATIPVSTDAARLQGAAQFSPELVMGTLNEAGRTAEIERLMAASAQNPQIQAFVNQYAPNSNQFRDYAGNVNAMHQGTGAGSSFRNAFEAVFSPDRSAARNISFGQQSSGRATSDAREKMLENLAMAGLTGTPFATRQLGELELEGERAQEAVRMNELRRIQGLPGVVPNLGAIIAQALAGGGYGIAGVGGGGGQSVGQRYVSSSTYGAL